MTTLKDKAIKLRASGLSYSEVAKSLNIPQSTVWNYCNKGRRKEYQEKYRNSLSGVIATKLFEFCRGSNNVITVKDFFKKFGIKPQCYLTREPIDLCDKSSYCFDHIVPKSKGGESTLDNLEVCSADANYAKGSMTLQDFIKMCHKVVYHNPLSPCG